MMSRWLVGASEGWLRGGQLRRERDGLEKDA